jgi:hypothetical protein
MNKTAIVVVLVAVVVAGYFVASRYSSPAQGVSEPQTKTFNLVVKGEKLVSGPSVLNVNQNDTVTINVVDDADEEVHLHGYNLHMDLKNGVPGSLKFVASSSGRFPYELELTSTEIGELDVQPQ